MIEVSLSGTAYPTAADAKPRLANVA
jgi:hypothetical protein